MIIITEYRKIGYSIIDALSVNPRQGRRIFSAKTEDVGTEDIDLIKEVAAGCAPDGYELFSCEIF